jgi:Subtilase family
MAAPPSQSGNGLPLRSAPSDAILVGERDSELVEPLLASLFAGRYAPAASRAAGMLVFDVRDVTPREVVDTVRSEFISKYGFRPHLSPRHKLTIGQPNVLGSAGGPPEPTDVPLDDRTGSEGEGVTVAIVDTGIQRHAWLDGGFVATPTSFEPHPEPNALVGRQLGHGLFLAGLVLEYAPGATVKVFRTANQDGESDIDDVANAIRKAGALGAHIVNLSLGCYTENNYPPWALVVALADLPSTTAVVASAGNANTTTPFWPAALPGVTAVGAVERNGSDWEAAEYSNAGAWVNAYADANKVTSTYIDVPVRIDGAGPDAVPYAGWARWSGTSMAAARWSGALARATGQLGIAATDANRLLCESPTLLGYVEEITLPGSSLPTGQDKEVVALVAPPGGARAGTSSGYD